jgi:hypothetical protein
MVLNRRHKALLFITLVITGCSLLLGAELKDALGFLLLGVAFAWAIGSDTASKFYAGLKKASNSFFAWIRLPVAMSFAGVILGGALLYSRANPVLAIGLMCITGVFIAPLTAIPNLKIWSSVPRILLGIAGLVGATFGIVSTDLVMSNQYSGRFGQLTVTAALGLLVGIMWLSKGWELIQKGITAQPSLDGAVPTQRGRVWPLYASLLVGLTLLTLWLGLLSWTGSSDWAYSPSEVIKQKKEDSNLLVQAGFIVLLAWWPYAAWKSILNREPNSEPKFLKRHKRVTALLGMIFVVVFGLVTTYGIQNGSDRVLNEKILGGASELKSVATKISSIKQRELKAIDDYIQAYEEIDALLPEFDSRVKDLRDELHQYELQNRSRGLVNIQKFYKTYRPEYQQNLTDIVDALTEDVALTRKETEVARHMSELPAHDQVAYWQNEFKPLLAQDGALGEKLRTLAAKQVALDK